MESRIHGDMYVRFGGRLAETYHRKVAKRCGPSLLKELADICGIKKKLTYHVARHSFAVTVCLENGIPIETLSKILGHTNLRVTQSYARITYAKVMNDMQVLKNRLEY